MTKQEDPERPSPLGADSVSTYVNQLRALKVWAGNPSLAQLRRLTGLPRSTLSDALSPERTRLPALDLVKRYTRACGCAETEIADWVSTWRAIQAAANVRSQGRKREDTVVPRQLPAAPRQFVGRAYELARLDELSMPNEDKTTLKILTITGQAGIGKTALALHWAHRAADWFPDGQLYLDLRGFSPAAVPVSPAVAIRYLLDALEVPPERLPSTMPAQTALFRSLVADRRMLFVLDNAVDFAQVRPLLPGGSAGLVLVTSRSRLTGLVAEHGAQAVALGPLSDGEARELLGGSIDPELVACESGVVRRLIKYCDRLPLALTIVGARASAEPAWPLTRLAAELADEWRRLDVLQTGDPGLNLRAVFATSYHALNPECRSMFRLLGVHPGPVISARALASLAGRPLRDVRRRLEELVRSHVVDEPTPGRFVVPDLLRTYATELANAHNGMVRLAER